jgi:hypothetical protein
MKALQLLTVIIFSSALMGCQIEVTPLSDEAVAGTGTDTPASNGNDTDARGDAGDTSSDTDTSNTTSVTLYWSAPLERVNGDTMENNEIGGYEIRYKKEIDSTYNNIVINDSSIDQKSIDDLDNADDYVFEVAVFDSDGIYSDFVIAMAN